LYAGDEATCVSVGRFLMKQSPFTSDSYRMFAALSRLCQSPVGVFVSGPEQKFLMRQIKIIDTLLLHPDSARPADAPAAEDLTHPDVNLLVTYGHILFASGSYIYALSMCSLSQSWRRRPKMSGRLSALVAMRWRRLTIP
jgi:general transcription factor 3C polypeptide 3 (transcription factor C subunit 4)